MSQILRTKKKDSFDPSIYTRNFNYSLHIPNFFLPYIWIHLMCPNRYFVIGFSCSCSVCVCETCTRLDSDTVSQISSRWFVYVRNWDIIAYFNWITNFMHRNFVAWKYMHGMGQCVCVCASVVWSHQKFMQTVIDANKLRK